MAASPAGLEHGTDKESKYAIPCKEKSSAIYWCSAQLPYVILEDICAVYDIVFLIEKFGIRGRDEPCCGTSVLDRLR